MFYVTKDAPDAVRVFEILSKGVERLEREEHERITQDPAAGADWRARARRMLNRLLTSAARRRLRPAQELAE